MASFEQVKRAVEHAWMSLCDLSRISNIGLAHLDESSAFAQQAERSIDELAGKTIENDVYTLTAGGVEKLLNEPEDREKSRCDPHPSPSPAAHPT